MSANTELPAVTSDGFLAGDDGLPLPLYRGCQPGDDDIGGMCPVTGETLAVMWFTSCPENAEFFQDGEVQRCHVRLERPIVFGEGQSPRCGPGPYVRTLDFDMGDPDAADGVIFRRIVDGSHPSDVYAVFPDDGSIAHAVRIVGRKTYGDDGVALYTGDAEGWPRA